MYDLGARLEPVWKEGGKTYLKILWLHLSTVRGSRIRSSSVYVDVPPSWHNTFIVASQSLHGKQEKKIINMYKIKIQEARLKLKESGKEGRNAMEVNERIIYDSKFNRTKLGCSQFLHTNIVNAIRHWHGNGKERSRIHVWRLAVTVSGALSSFPSYTIAILLMRTCIRDVIVCPKWISGTIVGPSPFRFMVLTFLV